MAGSAVAAAGVVVGVVLATGATPPQPQTQCTTAPRPLIVPGVPSTAVAGVRSAFAGWPKHTIAPLQLLARDHPSDPVVRFNYAVALLCKGYLADASTAFAAAKSSGRDTFYEMRADEFLHPQLFQPPDGLYPVFQAVGDPDPLLVRGTVAQRQGHQHTAERLFAQAARLHPADDQAQVAAAVALFDEDHLSRSFSRLGALTKRFPRSQSVHFHLGLLSAWVGLRAETQKQFALAERLGPSTVLGRQASAIVGRLVPNGTKGAKR